MTPPPDRLRALAREGAWHAHVQAIALFLAAKAYTPHQHPFETCPHPDCVLVREAPPKEQTNASQSKANQDESPEEASRETSRSAGAKDVDAPRRDRAAMEASVAPADSLPALLERLEALFQDDDYFYARGILAQLRALLAQQDQELKELARIKARATQLQQTHAQAETLLGASLQREERLKADHAVEVTQLRADLLQCQQEKEDLHLVAQGIKHYWLCQNNAASGGGPFLCERCRAEAAEQQLQACQQENHAAENRALARIAELEALEVRAEAAEQAIALSRADEEMTHQAKEKAEQALATLRTQIQQLPRWHFHQGGSLEVVRTEALDALLAFPSVDQPETPA